MKNIRKRRAKHQGRKEQIFEKLHNPNEFALNDFKPLLRVDNRTPWQSTCLGTMTTAM
jgi:hypothetical protein